MVAALLQTAAGMNSSEFIAEIKERARLVELSRGKAATSAQSKLSKFHRVLQEPLKGRMWYTASLSIPHAPAHCPWMSERFDNAFLAAVAADYMVSWMRAQKVQESATSFKMNFPHTAADCRVRPPMDTPFDRVLEAAGILEASDDSDTAAAEAAPPKPVEPKFDFSWPEPRAEKAASSRATHSIAGVDILPASPAAAEGDSSRFDFVHPVCATHAGQGDARFLADLAVRIVELQALPPPLGVSAARLPTTVADVCGVRQLLLGNSYVCELKVPRTTAIWRHTFPSVLAAAVAHDVIASWMYADSRHNGTVVLNFPGTVSDCRERAAVDPAFHSLPPCSSGSTSKCICVPHYSSRERISFDESHAAKQDRAFMLDIVRRAEAVRLTDSDDARSAATNRGPWQLQLTLPTGKHSWKFENRLQGLVAEDVLRSWLWPANPAVLQRLHFAGTAADCRVVPALDLRCKDKDISTAAAAMSISLTRENTNDALHRASAGSKRKADAISSATASKRPGEEDEDEDEDEDDGPIPAKRAKTQHDAPCQGGLNESLLEAWHVARDSALARVDVALLAEIRRRATAVVAERGVSLLELQPQQLVGVMPAQLRSMPGTTIYAAVVTYAGVQGAVAVFRHPLEAAVCHDVFLSSLLGSYPDAAKHPTEKLELNFAGTAADCRHEPLGA